MNNLILQRLYQCRGCTHEVIIATNHELDCYPHCKGKCYDIQEGSNKGNDPKNGGFRLPQQTAHKFIKNLE